MAEPLIELVIAGEPGTKGRPRFVRGGKPFTPEATRHAEDAIGWAIRAAYPGIEADASSTFHLRTHFAQATNQRRDLDNMVKLVSDACNSLVWKDDAQVVALTASLERGAAEAFTAIQIEVVGALQHLTRVCGRCGAQFRSYPSWGERPFCSAACAAQSQRRRVTINCQHCGAPFEVPAARGKLARYCSVACKAAAGRTVVACVVCGGQFSTPRSWTNQRRTCSLTCRAMLTITTRATNAGTCSDCGGGLSSKRYTRCRRCSTVAKWSAANDARMPVLNG